MEEKLNKLYNDCIKELEEIGVEIIGNKEEDYQKSNLEFKEDLNNYKYEIVCPKCGIIGYRKRIKKNLIRKYCCGKCGGKLQINQL